MSKFSLREIYLVANYSPYCRLFTIVKRPYSLMHKFREAIQIGGEAAMPAKETTAIDESQPAGKLAAAAKKRNETK